MPLLLVQALGTTSILKPLLSAQNDNLDNALERTKSFFLVNSMVADSLTFGLGGVLLGRAANGSESPYERQSPFNAGVVKRQKENEEHHTGPTNIEDVADEVDREEEEDDVRDTEESTLLPKRVTGIATRNKHRFGRLNRRVWDELPQAIQQVFSAIGNFVNPPFIGALVGVLLGLVPILKRAFFDPADEGGIFNAWLTTCVRNVGQLFPVLQVIVVGVKLRQSLQQMKKGEEGGELPWLAMIIVLSARYIIWPAISIPLIWALASKTSLLPNDPFLCFAMAIMPVGPPALKLTALADVTGSSEEEKMSIAKFLCIAYVLAPVMAFAVLGAVKASQASVAI